jgi:RNA polymerase sigma-70 factor (ECF subfamily)
MEKSDAELVAAVIGGDLTSYEELIKRHQPRIFGMVRRYSRRESDAEDIVQEVFIKAYQKLNTYRAEAPFEHWLTRLAVRVCYDYLRSQQRQPVLAFSELREESREWLENQAAAPDGPDANEEDARELVNQLLGQLSAPARMVITLLEIEERTVKEIAQITGWSTALVKVRAFRARSEMKKHLKLWMEHRKL